MNTTISILKERALGLLLPLMAVLLMAASLSLPASADTYENIGVYGLYDGPCTVDSCDTTSGCRITNNKIYDRWYAGKVCAGGLNESSGDCQMTWKLCRKIETWSGSGCTGSVESTHYQNKAMCEGSAPVEPPM